MGRPTSATLTVSDGVAEGSRPDLSGPAVGQALEAPGFDVVPREIVPDERNRIGGTTGSALVLNLPGGRRGAVESLEAVPPVLRHALDLVAGRTLHRETPPPVPAEPRVVATAVRVHGDPPCRAGQRLVLGRSGPLEGTLGCAEFDGAAAADVSAVLEEGEPVLRTYEHELGSVEVFLEPTGAARPTLVVLGATPVARG